jgi:ribosomal protein L37AE/L43A
MPHLRPLNPATCPACGKKVTRRVGYSEDKKGSIWRCGEPGCGRAFIVPTLALARVQKKPPS